MPDSPDSEPVGVPLQSVQSRAQQRSSLSTFLTYLVYEAHGMRIGLELSLCVICYTFVTVIVPWQALGVPLKWSTLLSWFGCCFAVILFDQLMLCRSAHTFRKAYLLGLCGSYKEALELLEKIGPQCRDLVHLPPSLYHLQRADIFTQSEDYEKAEAELHLAEFAGAPAMQLAVKRVRLLRAQGKADQAEHSLAAARSSLGDSPTLLLEEGLAMLEAREDLWAAKRVFDEVVKRPEAPHFAGETCHSLARAYRSITMLWTGEAEDGLTELSKYIERLRSAIIYVDALRPVLARLLLERGYYYSTHKQPTSAVIDYKLGSSLCRYAPLAALGEQIKEELFDRYEIKLY